MKVIISLACAMFVFAGIVTAQSDSDPVLQGSATYVMPQTAIDAEIGGKVVVGISVDDTGKPTAAALIIGPMWPCDTKPVKALEDLSSTLVSTMMKLKFAPATNDGKPVVANIGLTFELKNPKLAPKPLEIDPATGKPKPGLVSGGVINGKATFLPKPSYPAAAKVNRDGGPVSVQVLISEEGNVLRAGAISGAPTLQAAAREAACGAKFSPTKLAGSPVKVSAVLTYNFIP